MKDNRHTAASAVVVHTHRMGHRSLATGLREEGERRSLGSRALEAGLGQRNWGSWGRRVGIRGMQVAGDIRDMLEVSGVGIDQVLQEGVDTDQLERQQVGGIAREVRIGLEMDHWVADIGLVERQEVEGIVREVRRLEVDIGWAEGVDPEDLRLEVGIVREVGIDLEEHQQVKANAPRVHHRAVDMVCQLPQG